MSKELDRLEHLRLGIQYINQDESPAYISQYEEDINIIEAALKEKDEAFRKAVKTYQDLIATFTKPLEALEIIKEKGVDVDWLISNLKFGSLDDYNCDFELYKEDNWRILTQEEFDLLKEVLIDD